MRPHSNDTLVLPFSPFPHPRFTSLQERSLHLGRDDRWKTGSLTSSFTPLRGSILRLRRGPFGLTGRRLNGQARRLFGLGQTRKSLCGTSVSKGLLVSYITPLVPKHATYLPDESPSALAYRHPERRETPYVKKAPARTSGD